MKTVVIGQSLKCTNAAPLKGNDIAPPLKVNEVYELKSIHTCACGQEHYNVGLPLKVNWVTCYQCKKLLPENQDGIVGTIHWAHPTRFEPINQ